MIVNLGGEVVGSAEDTMKGKVDALYAMFDDLIHCVNEVMKWRWANLVSVSATAYAIL